MKENDKILHHLHSGFVFFPNLESDITLKVYVEKSNFLTPPSRLTVLNEHNIMNMK